MGYMKPRKVGGGNGTFTLDDMKNEDQGPIWSAHYDEDSGEIYYFNNNSCRVTDSLPSVVILSEPQRAGDSLKKVWEYICTVEGDYPKKFGAGGSAIELPDHSMLVCMGNAYSKIFIVTRDKNVTWSALPEMHIETDNIWANVKQYRANVIYRDKLEKLIWKAEISMKR
jgi:hypothetical protein